ncbi:hypothetical protein N7520_003933 [Penicillium odoratum]|uniref:uncharacterized protein n=1 Tax=Penicillium odoratum TaxID=1167516 RepID=UPI00254670E5|nr:uncharacterized protein N7520_003933 [Penicillium odoratum]KAJ5769374.1 hypothetical protein N7520_003933 [Penicillium odoratum]
MADTAPAPTSAPATGAPAAPAGGVTAGAPNAPNDQNAASRGLPYYEKLRRELRDTLSKKRLMDRSMAQLEDQIFRFEQSYLEETTAGNIIKGFDNYIKGSANASSLGASGLSIGSVGGRRKAQVTDSDRVFSRSSASYMLDSPGPSSAQTTPSHAATPTSTTGGNMPSTKSNGGDGGSAKNVSVSSKNKKKSSGGSKNTKGKNQTDELSDDDKPPVKRLKISYGRD